MHTYFFSFTTVPEAPTAVKALVMSLNAILVSWRAPTQPNGIVTHYTVYTQMPGSEPISNKVCYTTINLQNTIIFWIDYSKFCFVSPFRYQLSKWVIPPLIWSHRVTISGLLPQQLLAKDNPHLPFLPAPILKVKYWYDIMNCIKFECFNFNQLLWMFYFLVPAKVASFDDSFTASYKEDVKLPCLAVGVPPPTITWKVRITVQFLGDPFS